MKIVKVNSYDLKGGAAKAAFRIHKGLIKEGIDSKMVVNFKESKDPRIIDDNSNVRRWLSLTRPTIDSLPLKLYKNRDKTKFLSASFISKNINKIIQEEDPDIVHLHWINEGFLNIQSLKVFKNRPIVWTLHDMWAFTGVCHYSGDCIKYQESCGKCPQLGSNKFYDLSYFNMNRKKSVIKDLNLTIVTPSQWLADLAKKSTLFCDKPIYVIPNGVDLSIYRPIDKGLAREILGLPKDKLLILFGAMGATSDPRKGYKYLKEALDKLSEKDISQNVELVIFGSEKPINNDKFPFKSIYTGLLNDDATLALLYSSADIFVAPSVEDNLPNTILESIACGTPVVSFNIGGIPDLIEHEYNGYLANPYNTDDLLRGITLLLDNANVRSEYSRNARLKAETGFSLEQTSKKYIDLYKHLKIY